jgi:hypothetical protein
MAVKYTETMLSELRSIEVLNHGLAVAFAEKYKDVSPGITSRSVVAKARALDVPYQAKDPREKATGKAKGDSKDDIVARLYERLGTTIPSLSKVTVPDLKLLELAISELG